MKYLNGLNFGKVDFSDLKIKYLFEKKYKYLLLKLNPGEIYYFKKINIGSIVIFKSRKNSKIKINNRKFDVKNSNFFEFKLKDLNLKSNNVLHVALAGISKKINKNKINKFTEKQLYKVKKPWGYEIWINGQNPHYSFKKIFIKKGNQTSLQFHKKKVETNYLHNGKAEFFYSKKNGKNSSKSILSSLASKKIKKFTYINVNNYAVHRLKAISNITLFEVSTPHLDDVVRISDDTNRGHGKILSEHPKSK